MPSRGHSLNLSGRQARHPCGPFWLSNFLFLKAIPFLIRKRQQALRGAMSGPGVPLTKSLGCKAG